MTKERSRPFVNKLDGRSKAAEGALDDANQIKLERERITASDIAFQQALDRAISAKLEVCSTSPSTALGTKKPVFISP
jgi:hypothetical protein